MNVSSVRERVVLWIAAAIAGAVVIGGVVHLVLIAVTSGRPDVPVAPWVVVFAEDRGPATLVGQEQPDPPGLPPDRRQPRGHMPA